MYAFSMYAFSMYAFSMYVFSMYAFSMYAFSMYVFSMYAYSMYAFSMYACTCTRVRVRVYVYACTCTRFRDNLNNRILNPYSVNYRLIILLTYSVHASRLHMFYRCSFSFTYTLRGRLYLGCMHVCAFHYIYMI